MALKVPAILDPGFRPLEVDMRAYEKDVRESGRGVDFAVLILRNQGYCDHYKTQLFPDGEDGRTVPLMDRLVKTLLWARGGYKIVTFGSPEVHAHLLAAYRAGIRILVIPEENRKDLEKIPDYVLARFSIVPVKDITEVLKTALTDK